MRRGKQFLIGVSALAAGLVLTPSVFAQTGDANANNNGGVAQPLENAAHNVATGTANAYHKVKRGVQDEALETKVKAILDENKDTKNIGNVDIEADHGVVTLSGTVGSRIEAIRAAQVTSEVTGVKSVRNDLHYPTEGAAANAGGSANE